MMMGVEGGNQEERTVHVKLCAMDTEIEGLDLNFDFRVLCMNEKSLLSTELKNNTEKKKLKVIVSSIGLNMGFGDRAMLGKQTV